MTTATLPDFGTLEQMERGTTRLVLALDTEHVVKVQLDCSNVADAEYEDGNLWELRTWSKAEAEGWTYLLAAVVASAEDGSWLVQERCEPLPELTGYEDEGSEEFALWSAYRECLHEVESFVADLHPGNFGVTKLGQVVCLDFGCQWCDPDTFDTL